jgi:anaerobic magnesium-protoporphyrin IX monomethyl ester cyclase
MARILLINPSMKALYEIAQVKSSVAEYFPLNLLTIAAPLVKKGHEVRVLDLNRYNDFKQALINDLREFAPEYAGITFTTPLYSHSLKIVSMIKDYKADIITIAGGVHVTSDCMGTMKDSKIDIAVMGEGDYKLLEIVESHNIEAIKSIAYRKNDEIFINDRDDYIKNLDLIPFPELGLVDLTHYNNLPHTIRKKNPVFPLETSRGCVYECSYCNKSIFGKTFRVKTPERVIEDLKKIADLGYREVHIVDDGFTTNIDRVRLTPIFRPLA